MDLRPNARPLPGVSVAAAPHGWMEAILALAVAVLVFWFLVLPKQAKVSAAANELKKLETLQAQFEKNRATTETLVGKLSGSTAAISELDEAIPLDARPTKVRLAVESLARSLDLTLSTLEISSRTDSITAGSRTTVKDPFGVDRSLQVFNVTAELSGSVEQLQAFLEKVESSGRVLQVENMDVSAGQDRPSMRLTMAAYYYSPSAK